MSIDPAHIARLAALMERHGLATLDYDLGGAALSLRMAPSATAAPRGAPSPVAASESVSAPVETPGTRLIPPRMSAFSAPIIRPADRRHRCRVSSRRARSSAMSRRSALCTPLRPRAAAR